MIFNAAIFDDEYYVRKSIIAKIDSPFINIVFDTDNGKELIDYLKKKGAHSLDLVLVDIVTPLMDGLTLIQELQKINPDLVFLIISGYSDFEYTQKAIRLGVTDYIMKPIIPETLNRSVETICQKLIAKDLKDIHSGMDCLCQYISSNLDSHQHITMRAE